MLKRFWKRSMNNAIVKSPLIHKSLIDFHDWFYVFIEKRINRFVVQVNFGDGKSRQVATNNPGRLLEYPVKLTKWFFEQISKLKKQVS